MTMYNILFEYIINPFIADQKKVKSVPTYGDITQQQAVKLELSVYYTTLPLQ